MRAKQISRIVLVWVLLAASFLALGLSRSEGQTMKLEVQLLWGTTNAVSPNPKHKPVEPAIDKKLKELPLKWSHYFVVNRQGFEVPLHRTNKVALSEKCAIEVTNLGH